MDPGDIMYSNVCTQPLVIMVRRGDGQLFDFQAGKFDVPPMPFPVSRFCLAMKPDTTTPTLKTTQRCVIPVAARQDPQAEMIEAILPPSGFPQPTQTDWIAVDNGVPMGLARGAKLIFT